MGSALHTDMYRCLGVPGTSSGRVYDHGFWTLISVGEAPFGMGIVVDLHAPDCKTASSSSGSSGMGLALGNGIAYSDASRPQKRESPAQHAAHCFQPQGGLMQPGVPEEEAHCSV